MLLEDIPKLLSYAQLALSRLEIKYIYSRALLPYVPAVATGLECRC